MGGDSRVNDSDMGEMVGSLTVTWVGMVRSLTVTWVGIVGFLILT